jgi:cation:H+ antiporter
VYQILTNLTDQISNASGFAHLAILTIAMIIGLFLLTKGGDYLSDHSSHIAEALGVPSVVIGLTIVSIATSAPELFTSIAAIRGQAEGLILGNIIGSNIANISLILGLVLFIKPIETKGAISNNQIMVLLLLTLSFCCVLFFDPTQTLSFGTGIALLGFIFFYLCWITTRAFKKRNSDRSDQNIELKNVESSNSLAFSVFVISLSAVALWAGSDFLVFGAKNLASLAGVPEELIGFTILAIGTSLPELATSISLVRKAKNEMLLGNIVGSNLFNIGLVGGVAGILGPVNSRTPHPWIEYLSLVLITALFCYWLKGRKLDRKEGVLLLAIYFAASSCTWIWNG